MSNEFGAANDGHDDETTTAEDRRSFLRKAAVGAFAVPVISTFSMGGIQAAFAQTPTESDAGTPPTVPPTTPTTEATTTTAATTTTVAAPVIDLAVSITGPGAIVTGDEAQITHTLTNAGANPSSGTITFQIDRPTSGTLTPPAAPSGWTRGPDTPTGFTYTTTNVLAPGATVDFVATYGTVDPGTPPVFAASIPNGSGGDTTPGNNSATKTINVIEI
jgi:hypothetical protein